MFRHTQTAGKIKVALTHLKTVRRQKSRWIDGTDCWKSLAQE